MLAIDRLKASTKRISKLGKCLFLMALVLTELLGLGCVSVQAQPGQYAQPYYKSAVYFNTYRQMVRYYNSSLSANDVDLIVQAILYYSHYYAIDPRLVTAVIACESRFNPRAISPAGAIGLGQLMPDTARTERTDPYNIVPNVHGSCRVLCRNLKHYHDNGSYKKTGDSRSLRLALAAYNAGPNAVDAYNDIPPYPETTNYVNNVLAEYQRLCGRR